MNYEEMSDLQINLLVANAIGVDAAENQGVVFGAVKHEGGNIVSVIDVVDYCNNPSDAWPIIVENNISMRPIYIRDSGGRKIIEWECKHAEREWPNKSYGWDDKNPLRAAMIVFLMMEEAGK